MAEMSTLSHVLVIPYPIHGHITPMVQLSKRLASRGVGVTVITPTSTSACIQVSSSLIRIESIPDGVKPDSGFDAISDWLKDLVSNNLAEIMSKVTGSGCVLTTVVYDSIMPWVADLVHQLGLRAAAFNSQSCAVFAVYHHTDQENLTSPTEGSTVSLPSMPPLGLNDLPSFVRNKSSYSSLLRFVLSRNLNTQKADWLLFNTFDELEKEVLEWMASQFPLKVIAIGPLLPSMYLDKRVRDDDNYGLSLFKPNNNDCMEWLDSQETGSVVYVSFGSLANLKDEQMCEVAQGLIQSKCKFLWVVRSSEQSKLPSNFLPDKSGAGIITNWCPQLDVLSHRAVGCFVTHCGWNSTLEALSLGVPVVAMPQWTDQPTNAKYLVDVWDVGIRVMASENGMVTREEVERCLVEVMKGERGVMLKENAAKWKQLAKEAVDEGGSSDKNIKEFVSAISM
nr:UDP-glycosyltransferase 74E2-like [Ipomoea batatas]